MSREPDPMDAVAVDAAVLKDRIDELRRSLFGDQSRLKRRSEDVRRFGELEARLADEALSPADRKSIEDVRGSLRRGVERSRLVDGSDEALAQRTAQQELSLANLERQWRELKARAAKVVALPVAVDADKENERAQRGRRQRLMTALGTLERQVDALHAGAGMSAAAQAAVDEFDLSDNALRSRFMRLSERIERLVPELRGARRSIAIRVATLEQELEHWNRSRARDPTADLDALSRHLRNEMQRFVQLLDAHLGAQFAQSLQYMEESAIGRFNQTDAEPEMDPAFEQISFRAEDVQLLSDLARVLVEPHLQAQGGLLPARSVLACSSFRGHAASAPAGVASLPDIATRSDLQIPAIPVALVSQMVQAAVQLKSVAPLSPRSEVTPLRRLLRGDILGAVGSLLMRAARYPARLLQPLGILSLIGFVVTTEVKSYFKSLPNGAIAIVFVILLAMTYRSWTKEARLGEIELLKKGKATLREQLARQLDGLRQTWTRLLNEHCERFIDQTLAELRARPTSSTADELRIQRECKRVDAELRDRSSDQRRLHDAHAQASRLARENVVVLRAAVEAELASVDPARTL